jgi:catechol 2,3-dioxygenase-like lactoylglutathione lyase family enzyme
VTDSPLGSIEMVACSLYVADLDAAIAWYAEKLGLQPMAIGTDEQHFAPFSIGGAIVVLEPIEAALEPARPGAENTTLNVLIDRDPAEVRAELMNRGVSCSELDVSSDFVSFLLRDLDGNRFYISRAASDEARLAMQEAAEVMIPPATTGG